MHKYLVEAFNYWQYKILAGLWATFWSDDIAILFLLFLLLELLDIFTRWLSLSKSCFNAIYPRTECSLWRAFTFIWQARRWRFICSTGLRDGFCDKILTYSILLLVAATVDAALQIAGVPRALLMIVTTVLVTTEALSILENLSDCGLMVVSTIKEKFAERFKK